MRDRVHAPCHRLAALPSEGSAPESEYQVSAQEPATYLLHDRVNVGRAEGLLQFLALRNLSLRDVHEDVGDLEDIVDVGLYTAAPFLDFVLVASDLEAFAALFEANDRDVREPAARLLGVQRSG